MLTIKRCKCGKSARQLVIIKSYSLFLCEKHVKTLEQFLGEKLEPLTRNYYETREIAI
jgi:diphthamide biosynthesis methyltransferase